MRRRREPDPGFRTERLLRDADRRGHYVIASEWDERAHYDAFVRDSGALWFVYTLDTRWARAIWASFEEIEQTRSPSRPARRRGGHRPSRRSAQARGGPPWGR